jgi:hypothetical protein
VTIGVAGGCSLPTKADDRAPVAVRRRRRGRSALSELGTSFTRSPQSERRGKGRMGRILATPTMVASNSGEVSHIAAIADPVNVASPEVEQHD